jgi:hypothetical protein
MEELLKVLEFLNFLFVFSLQFMNTQIVSLLMLFQILYELSQFLVGINQHIEPLLRVYGVRYAEQVAPLLEMPFVEGVS